MKTPATSLKRICTVFLSVAAFATHCLAADSSIDEDREACKKNLGVLYKAIKAYRSDKKDLPAWLSDLVPKYVKDPNALVCPTVKKTGTVVNYGITDPKHYQYFSVHIEADREHSAAEREMLGEHVNSENFAKVQSSVTRVLDALWDMLSGVCRRHAIAR